MVNFYFFVSHNTLSNGLLKGVYMKMKIHIDVNEKKVSRDPNYVASDLTVYLSRLVGYKVTEVELTKEGYRVVYRARFPITPEDLSWDESKAGEMININDWEEEEMKIEGKEGIKVVALLGDSIIDNKVYVGENELSVTEHLQKINDEDYYFEMIAVDGDTTKEVIDNQLEKIRANTSHIVLSIGGNDLLQKLDIMFNETSGMIESLEIASQTIEEIKSRYEEILIHLKNLNQPVLLCTIYEGDLQSDQYLAEVEEAGKVLLGMMNDTIHFLGKKHSIEVLELRNIFTEVSDYANPIEPSHKGGEKLAKEIINWLET